MMTVLTVIALLLLAGLLCFALACMVNALLDGCPFAWIWFLCGGLDSLVGAIAGLVGAALEAFSGQDS